MIPSPREDPEAQQLCTLWGGLTSLQQLSPLPILPVSNSTPCIFADSPSSAEPLCFLWCQIKLYVGVECEVVATPVPCPAEYQVSPTLEINIYIILTFMTYCSNSVSCSQSHLSNRGPRKRHFYVLCGLN